MVWDPYRRERQPWRDTMQVCLNGHVINESVRRSPEYNKEYCSSCGAKTITNCPTCNNPIPGEMQDTGVAVIGFPSYAPSHCQSCGNTFPWTDAKEEKQAKIDAEKPFEKLIILLEKFHILVRQMRKRRENRPTLDVTDEYDVQDFLHVLLKVYFDDIRPEEWTPSYAGKSSRMDFLLSNESIVVETKMTRKGLTEKEIGDELLVDILRYSGHPRCQTLVCFIYDPDGRINNPVGLAKDLEKQSTEGLEVRVFINS